MTSRAVPPRPMRAVIGGVGYRHLRDHSLGIAVTDALESAARPPALHVEDLSYNPVAVAQWFADEARTAPFTRAIFVTAVPREDGRPPGTLCAYRWDRTLPPPDLIQRAVTDAVTGVIHVDNTVVVAAWMGGLPAEVIVVEVEPLEHAFGDEMSAAVARAYEDACRLVLRLGHEDALGDSLPVAPLGGGWVPAPAWSAAR